MIIGNLVSEPHTVTTRHRVDACTGCESVCKTFSEVALLESISAAFRSN